MRRGFTRRWSMPHRDIESRANAAIAIRRAAHCARHSRRIIKVHAAPVRYAVDVDAGLWPPRGPQANALLQADARGRDGGVRQALAAGVAPMTNHHEEPTPLPALVWAVVFTILLVAAVAYSRLSLFASGITTGRAKRLPRHPNSCVGDVGRATSCYSTRRWWSAFGGKPVKHMLVLSFSGFDPEPT